MSQIVSQTSPLVIQLVGLFFLSAIVVGLIIWTDIKFHDDYVGTIIKVCNPQNQENLCMEFRSRLFLPPDAQIELGNAYWEVLKIQAVVIAFAFGGFKFVNTLARRLEFTPVRIFVILLYAFVPLIFFTFGAVDIFYFWARGMEIPDQLVWLDNVGFLEHTKIFGQTIHVDRSDLLATFLLGVGLIILLFFIAMKLYQKERLRGAV